MRRTVKVLSYILISSIVTSLAFASDKKTEEELLKNKLIEQGKVDLPPPGLDVDLMLEQEKASDEKNLFLRATTKPYSGFLGTKVTPTQKQYPEGVEGAVFV